MDSSSLVRIRILIYLIQSNHRLGDYLKEKSPTLYDLWECDLCLGFWVHLCIGVRRLNPVQMVVQAAVNSFVSHVFLIGLKERLQDE